MKRKSPTQTIKVLRALVEEKGEGVLFEFLSKTNDSDAIKKMFVNARVRDGDGEGHRLTRLGYEILKTVYDHRYIELTKPLNGKQYLRLARACALPYFVDTSGIGIFEAEIGVWLLMAGGNPDLFDNALPLRNTLE